MRVRGADRQWIPIALMGGFAEVENNEVVVLVNGAERGEAIDLEEARTAYSQAETEFNRAQATSNPQERIQAMQTYKRARARLQAAGGSV
jgi:F-type H+-transporting ATPase subunit epsilon